MKDDKLEKEFEEYFKGINTPDDITEGAKKYVKPKNKFSPWFLKLAPVAASLVIVCAVTITFAVRGADRPTAPAYTFYTDAELQKTENADLISLVPFLKNFELADNAIIKGYEISYNASGLALIKADVSVQNGLHRDDTEIYVEFTEPNLIYDGLAEYYDGAAENYRGAVYYLTRGIADNGEPEYKLQTNFNGVKYYFCVTSTEENAHIKYLEMVTK